MKVTEFSFNATNIVKRSLSTKSPVFVDKPHENNSFSTKTGVFMEKPHRDPSISHKKPAHPKGQAGTIIIVRSLPDDNSFLLRKEHRSVGYAEGLVEGLDVAEGCVHTVLAEGVDIGLGEAGCLLVTDVLAPDCRV